MAAIPSQDGGVRRPRAPVRDPPVCLSEALGAPSRLPAVPGASRGQSRLNQALHPNSGKVGSPRDPTGAPLRAAREGRQRTGRV